MEEAQEILSESDIESSRMFRRIQPAFRQSATHAGLFHSCRLPQCRRAKRCCGCHPAAEIATTHFKKFPPCVHDNASHAALMRADNDIYQREYQRVLSAGFTPKEIERAEETLERYVLEKDDWPPDPLCPPPRPKKRGR